MRNPMTDVVRGERGIALAIAIFALVVVGALVAGAFFAGSQEQRLAQNAKRVTQAFGVAEVGVAEVVRTWNPVTMNAIPTYPANSLMVARTRAPSGSGSYDGVVYKLNGNLFLVDVAGADTMSRANRVAGGGARQRLGMINRIKPLQVDVQAGLTTRGNVSIQGNGAVSGINQNPAGWAGCPAPGPNVAGVRTTGTVSTGGNGTVVGTPPVNQDPSLNDATFTQFGDQSFADLAASATITLPGGNYGTAPSLSGGACRTGDNLNWGDGMNPLAPCGSYFPIVYVNGNLRLNGTQGQGILLVNGNVDVQGSYEYYGIVIAMGEFKTAGGGTSQAHFWGGVLASNVTLDNTSVSGHANVNYSACAITRVLQGTSRAAPLRSRGWAQLF